MWAVSDDEDEEELEELENSVTEKEEISEESEEEEFNHNPSFVETQRKRAANPSNARRRARSESSDEPIISGVEVNNNNPESDDELAEIFLADQKEKAKND